MIVFTNLQATQVRALFVNFCIRSGILTEQQAVEELSRLFANPVRMRLRDSYITMSRVGASFTLTRTQRCSIYETFSNAVNHVTFAE